MRHVFFVWWLVVVYLAVFFQRHGTITSPGYWAGYGAMLALSGSWILDMYTRRAAEGTPTMLSMIARKKALDVLANNGLRAHYYFPAVGVEDRVLADACRLLAGAGHLITDNTGVLVGKVATVRPTLEELVKERRASFRLVKADRKG